MLKFQHGNCKKIDEYDILFNTTVVFNMYLCEEHKNTVMNIIKKNDIKIKNIKQKNR